MKKANINFKLRKISITMIQICILYVFSLAGNYMAEVFHLNFPGSLIGMGLLFTFLRLGIFPSKWVDSGGAWLLAELLLFFIPSVVAITQYEQLFRQEGAVLFLIILLSTLVVMVSSGLTAELVIRHKLWRRI